MNPNVFAFVNILKKYEGKKVIRIHIPFREYISSRRVSQSPTTFSSQTFSREQFAVERFLNHPVEMCPLDDKVDTNAAAKTCGAPFEVGGLMYSK